MEDIPSPVANLAIECLIFAWSGLQLEIINNKNFLTINWFVKDESGVFLLDDLVMDRVEVQFREDDLFPGGVSCAFIMLIILSILYVDY